MLCVHEMYTTIYMKSAPRRAKSRTSEDAKEAKRVVIDFPEPLLRNADHMANELRTNRSRLIRSAVKEFLERRERQKLNRELAAGYAANAASALVVADEMMESEREFS